MKITKAFLAYNKENNMKIKNIIITISIILTLNIQAEESFFSDIKNKANNLYEDVKENNTTKSITSSISSSTSSIIKYLKPDENQSILDKTKQISNEAIQYTQDKYKEIIK
jgi:hypothetical protein